MKKFIYVFDIEDKNALVNNGFELVKEDLGKSLFVFRNKKQANFGIAESISGDYILTDSLTF